MEKDLKYWKERGGQIEWRLIDAHNDVSKLTRDLRECDERIREIQAKAGVK